MNPNGGAASADRDPPPASAAANRSVALRKILVLLILAAVFAVVFFQYRHTLSLAYLAEQESVFRQYRVDHPVAVYGIAFLIYVGATGLSLPGAFVLTLAFGWFFGFWPAVMLVSFASTAGATIAFLISRSLLRDSIQNRFGDRLSGFNRALKREGVFYLFTLRLIPAVPFFVINVVMGLTPIRASTFWWVSQIGMLPGTCVYVYAGSEVPTIQQLAERGTGDILTPGIVIAFVILGLFPIVVKKIINQVRPPTARTNE